jgi:hypothetical protein
MDRRAKDRRGVAEVSPLGAAETGKVRAGGDEPRRKKQRRRQIDPTTCERDYSGDEIEFMQAMDAYKRAAGRMFPTCSEILEVIRSLGYCRLTAEQLALVQVNELQAELSESFDYDREDDISDEECEEDE